MKDSHIVTIFGGTGDLTYRKLIPAFYNLFVTQQLPASFHLVMIGRRDFTSDSYRETVTSWINKYARVNVEKTSCEAFLQHITYFKMTFTEDEGYADLRALYDELDPNATKLYYLAVAPTYFETIAEKLEHHGLTENSNVIIEKPFGNDLESACKINDTLTRIFTSEHIYRIDHYVAKEMVQNIFTIRFANMLFANIWNSRSISNIQISAAESVGVENRGNYYDHTGALKDMFQNHLLQIISIVLMDKPRSMSAEDIHAKQEEVLESLFIKSIHDDIVYGQYDEGRDEAAYLQEEHIAKDSSTETFVALRLQSTMNRWIDTPIYVRTGKRMHKRSTEIMIEFKQRNKEKPNVLIIKIQPDEGIYLRMNIKKPGQTNEIQTVFMDFCQSCNYENRENTPEAYERLLNSALSYDHALFASFKQVKLSWAFVEEILQQKGSQKPHPYPSYSSGPLASHELLQKDGHAWIEEHVLGDIFEAY